MRQEKIAFSEFVRQISKDTGYAQHDISAVLKSSAGVIRGNLENGKSTQVFPGMVVYPSTYNNEYKFARARFGNFFRDLDSAILE